MQKEGTVKIKGERRNGGACYHNLSSTPKTYSHYLVYLKEHIPSQAVTTSEPNNNRTEENAHNQLSMNASLATSTN